jgi:hypothetical protein
MTSDDFERYLLVKGVNHIPVPRGEHHGIGVAEKAIQDLSNMMRSYLTDSNLPGSYWDYVVEHAALVNRMITPSITDKSRTIFEHVWGVVPNLDLIPPIVNLKEERYSTQSHPTPVGPLSVYNVSLFRVRYICSQAENKETCREDILRNPISHPNQTPTFPD